jgi:hypothetical protein
LFYLKIFVVKKKYLKNLIIPFFLAFFLISAIPIESHGEGPNHSYCKHDPSKDDDVCETRNDGNGSFCAEKECGGWFEPSCDCYGIGWDTVQS